MKSRLVTGFFCVLSKVCFFVNGLEQKKPACIIYPESGDYQLKIETNEIWDQD